MTEGAAQTARRLVLEFMEESAAVGARASLAGAARMVSRAFPDIQLHYVDIDVAAGEVAAATTAGAADHSYRSRLVTVVDDHPMILSHLPLRWPTLTPRRMSDVISDRDLRNTRAYWELLRPAGIDRQVAIMTSIHGKARGTAWVLNRSQRDFDDHELELAVALQPSLAVLQKMLVQDEGCSEATTGIDGRHLDYGLTGRERQVLQLVSDGLTAVHIAHVLRISAGTVRKHLDNVYGKLDAHDRLVAVTRAREAGLVT